MSLPFSFPLRTGRSAACLLALLALAACAPRAVPHRSGAGDQQAQARPRNVILLVPDGLGPAGIALGRAFAGRDLALDALLVGTSRTAPAVGPITDSAAGATAFATGFKARNGAIAVDTLDRPLATVLEAAERRGLATGLVTTAAVTDATPASFSAHVPNRNRQTEIAEQQMAQGIEVLLGGGRRYFLPEGTDGGQRTDGRNLLEEARRNGYQIARTRAEFDRLTAAPVLGLFAPEYMSYVLERDPQAEPDLAAMARKAITLLEDDPDGFFLLVESEGTDNAGHANDPAALAREVLAFDEAVAVALDFARRNGETLVIAVADHETGGLTLGRTGEDNRSSYTWRPEVLAGVKHSAAHLAARIAGGDGPAVVLREQAGLTDLTPDEEALLAGAGRDEEALRRAVARLVSRRALVGWTTYGHTAVDVNVYAYGPGAERLHGNQENTRIGRVIAELLGFDLAPLTTQLRERIGPGRGK